jgi:CheY-like chemotaxis protein
VLERVFEPFFTTKETGKGTGLGLSMVYGFVQQSGGYVEVDSAPDKGTKIRLFLPRAHGEVTAAELHFETADTIPIGQGEAVLVVEDNSDVRQVAVSTLKSLGFTVTETETADEAADLLKSNCDFRLVLSDVRMPGKLSGVDLASLIKTNYPNVQVLLTTGYAEDAALIEEVDLIYKPYRAADLAQKIQSMSPQIVSAA